MKRILIIYILFLSAGATNFTTSLAGQLFFLFLVFLNILLTRKAITLEKRFVHLLVGTLILGTIQFFVSGAIILGMVKFLVLILALFILLKQYQFNFLRDIASVIFYLALISVPFYFLQLMDIGLLKSFFSSVNFSFDSQKNAGGVYFFIFNINPWNEGRNSGFMWEPGAFGAMMLLAMIIFYFVDGTWKSKRVLILTLISLTTISTTTYLGLLIFSTLIIWEVSRGRFLRGVLLSGMLIILCLIIFQLPFMGEKIREYLEVNVDYVNIFQTFEMEKNQSIGRFAGFMIEWDRFLESPIFGSGWHANYMRVTSLESWSNPSGLASLLGKFGLIGIFLMTYFLKLFTDLAPNRSFVERVVVYLIIGAILFSNPFHDNLVVWLILLIGYYYKPEIKHKRVSNTTISIR